MAHSVGHALMHTVGSECIHFIRNLVGQELGKHRRNTLLQPFNWQTRVFYKRHTPSVFSIDFANHGAINRVDLHGGFSITHTVEVDAQVGCDITLRPRHTKEIHL
ncbi:hypothetical protein D3C75_1061810 [compost metagenome]